MSASILVEKLIQCALLVILGFLCGKQGMIDDSANRKLSGLLLNIVSPCIILTSYQAELSQEILQNMLIALFASAGSLLLMLLGTFVFVRRSQPEFRVERMCVIYGNCGFMGLALIYEMFGAEGVLYNTAYITVSTMLLWTHGVILMSGAADGKTVLKNLLTPSLISILVGLLMFLTRFRIPSILENTLEMVGVMNTPLAMIIAGVSIAGSDLRAAFSRFRFYYITFVHNLLMPALLVLLLAVICECQ